MSNKIIFITGGARSGKSAFALKKASEISGRKAYIATAEALDNEMKKRIEKHKNDRGNNWDTYEEPVKIAELIKTVGDKYKVVLVDCLTLWLSNLIHTGREVNKEIESFISSLVTHHSSLIFIVSNEVGMGIVPDNKMAREFRDWAGFLNQKIAGISDEVYLIAAGIPLRIK
ncbi:MAG: bifunctional adenosylcobinamide kinase/adenosylcobinamide-phosphate guanylyltransferase [Nitrospirota bacterium]